MNKALVKGGRDCGHCLSLATSHKCGWCSTIEVCTTLSQCKSNPFNSTTHQVSIHDYFLFLFMGESLSHLTLFGTEGILLSPCAFFWIGYFELNLSLNILYKAVEGLGTL